MQTRLFLFLFAACGVEPVTLHPLAGDAFVAFDVDALPPAEGDPDAALAIVRDGRLESSIRGDTLFAAASLSKMITAIVALQEVERGTIGLDDPVAPWLDLGVPDPGVTLRHALTHTSGVPDLGRSACEPRPLREAFVEVKDQPLWSPPGRLYNYSNGGYLLIGAVLEAIHERPFRQLVRERVLGPAGMSHASFDPSGCVELDPAGGLFASVTDYAHLVEALWDGKLLGAAMVEQMASAQVETGSHMQYGFGLFVLPVKETRIVFHPGNRTGFNSSLFMLPEKRFAAIAMSAQDGSGAEAVALDAVMREGGISSLALEERPHRALSDYEGIYSDDNAGLGRFEVRAVNDALVVTPRDATARTALLRGGLTFFFDQKGHVEYATSRFGVARIYGRA